MSHVDGAGFVAAPLGLSVLGTPFAVDAAEPAVGAELRRLLAPFVLDRIPVGSSVRTVHAPVGGNPGLALLDVLTQVNTTALAAAGYLAVHAGVVARGRTAVAFPAPSGTGKSTLTAACLRAGLDYVSDEALCLDWASGAVVGYPRPLALSGWSARAVGVTPGASGRTRSAAPTAALAAAVLASVDEVLLTAADLGAAVAAEPLTLAHIVLPRRDPNAVAALAPLPRGEAVGELLARSFTSWHRPDRAFTLVHEVVAAARTWRLTLGRPADAADLLADLLATA